MRAGLTRKAMGAGLVLALAASTAGAVMTGAAAAEPDDGFGPRAEVLESAETGAVTFVGSPAGKPLPAPDGITASSTSPSAAKAFVSQNDEEFGLGARSNLTTTGVTDQATGNTTVRVQQTLDGIEVLGGELAVQVDEDNRIVSTVGEVLPESTTARAARPQVSRDAALRSAKAYVARAEGVAPSAVSATYEGVKIFDSRLLGGPVPPGANTVHAVEVSYGDDVRRQVFIEASMGAVLASFDEIHSAKSRRVCDAGNADRQLPCTSPVLTEGGSTSGFNADVVQAYAFSGATYDWFKTQFNRDSIDGRGMPLVSTVRYCPRDEACPFKNAFWDGKQMTYGPGYAVADDVVAHELTHGITERTSRLFYYYQSGAINESMSDIFGELVDLATPSSRDGASDRWRMGESLPKSKPTDRDGAIRDMANPNAFGDPASMRDRRYYAGANDNGGVHYNSGVGNKAASLLVDGGSLNGQTVTSIGTTKAGAVFYEANTGLLTSASDYQDLARALRQACKNLTGTKSITSADCGQVDRAVRATQMDTPRPNAVDMKTCSKASWTFSDGLEKGGKKWKGSRPWFAPGNPNNLGLDATYASTGVKNLWGADAPGNAFPRSRKGKARDYSIRTKRKVKVPKHKSSFLRFRHAYFFDSYGTRNYDGGRVEYSLNGKKWSDLMGGKYPKRVHRSSSASLRGKKAFAGVSGGYRTTVKKFPKKVRGKKVFIRFRMSTDATPNVWTMGWFIDDIGVGRCK